MSIAGLHAHLATGTTHVCHCWSVRRTDNVTLGFTDHDAALTFDDIVFEPESGLSAKALASTTGLSTNNSEAIGVLQSSKISEADINAGRYDGATVTIWLVQWDDPEARQVRFAGTIGEISRTAGGFQAELRGLTEALNQPQGRSYLRSCSAVLGDAACRVDLDQSDFTRDVTLLQPTDQQVFRLADDGTKPAHWFEGGSVEVLDGQAEGLQGLIKLDRLSGGQRIITLWQPIRAPIAIGNQLRLVAGCDRRAQTCREKFGNFLNFQGFPDIPGDDWLVSVPRSNGKNSGGSLTR